MQYECTHYFAEKAPCTSFGSKVIFSTNAEKETKIDYNNDSYKQGIIDDRLLKY